MSRGLLAWQGAISPVRGLGLESWCPYGRKGSNPFPGAIINLLAPLMLRICSRASPSFSMISIISIERGNYNPSLELAFKIASFEAKIEDVFIYR